MFVISSWQIYELKIKVTALFLNKNNQIDKVMSEHIHIIVKYAVAYTEFTREGQDLKKT